MPIHAFVPQRPDSNCSMLPVRLVNVRPRADISGVITAIRSSAPISLFSASIKGARILDCPFSRDESRIEEQDDDAGPRILRSAPHFVHRRRLARRGLGPRGAHRYLLELGDLLRDAVFENLDIGLLKIGDGLPVRRRVHIDADVVDFGGEGSGDGPGGSWAASNEKRRTKKEKSPAVTQTSSTRNAWYARHFSFFVFRFSLPPVQESLHPGCIGPHFSEELVQHHAPAVATFSERFVPTIGMRTRYRSLHELGREALNLVSKDDEQREPGLPIKRSDGVLDGFDAAVSHPALRRSPMIASGSALPRHGLLRAQRGLRNFLRRRRTREAGQMKARQPHSVGGPKERADVVEAAHVVQKHFYDGPGPS